MADYYRNDLFIRGPEQELLRFQRDALPKDNESGGDSWGGHSEGSLSFLSLIPLPGELRSPRVDCKDVDNWKDRHWGCLYPDVDYYTLQNECLNYHFVTTYCCAHNFVLEVSKSYPALAFTLLWNNVHEGSYGQPMQFAMLTVQAGVKSMDYVEMYWDTVLDLQDKLPPLNKLNEDARRSVELRIADIARNAEYLAEVAKRDASASPSVPSNESPDGNLDAEEPTARMF